MVSNCVQSRTDLSQLILSSPIKQSSSTTLQLWNKKFRETFELEVLDLTVVNDKIPVALSISVTKAYSTVKVPSADALGNTLTNFHRPETQFLQILQAELKFHAQNFE